MIKQHSVLINSTECKTKVVSWKVKKSFGNFINTCVIKALKGIKSLVTLQAGQSIQLYRGDTSPTQYYEFKGTIEKVEEAGGWVIISGKQELAKLQRARVIKAYDSVVDPSAGKISEIIKDLVTTYGGMNADSSTIQDSGTANTLTKFVCNHASVWERTQQLLYALNWQMYYLESTDKVYAEPKGFAGSGLTLTVGTEIKNVPSWVTDKEGMANDVEVIGAEDVVEYTKFFSGDASETEFEMPVVCRTTKIWVDSVLQIGGKTDSTETFDYERDDNYENLSGDVVSLVIFQSASTPPIGTNNIEVRYGYPVPVPVSGSNSTSVLLYGSHQKTAFLLDSKNVADAVNLLNTTLDLLSEPFISAELHVVNTPGLVVGQKVTIVDSINDKNLELVMNEIEVNYPLTYDKVVVGDKLWRLAQWQFETENRIRRLEESMAQDIEKLTYSVRLNRQIEFRRKKFQVYRQAKYNTFIWGSSIYGENRRFDTQDAWDTGTKSNIDTSAGTLKLQTYS